MAVVGWILLGILAFVLLILLLLLFFPVSYRLEAEKTAERLTVKAKAYWLFGLIRVEFLYPEPGKPQIRAAWFSLDRTQKEKSRKIKPASSKKASEVPKSGEASLVEKEAAQSGSASEDLQTPSGVRGGDSPSGESEEKADDLRSGGKKAGFKAKAGIAERYRKIRTEADFYWKLWQKEETRSLVSEIFARLLKIFRNVFPRRIRGRIVFGAASPDITGYVLAVYSIVRVRFPKRLLLEFTPDFERQVLEGEIWIRGHVMAAVLVWNILRVAVDRRLREILRQVSGHIS